MRPALGESVQTAAWRLFLASCIGYAEKIESVSAASPAT